MKKKILFVLVPIVLLVFFAVKSLPPQTVTEPGKPEVISDNKSGELMKIKAQYNPGERVKQNLSCKSCHASEYPTKNDPGLMSCPRTEMVSVYHAPGEGPDVVIINEMSDYYSGVVFSHRVHAEMSEISGGCTGCHHFNTAGPVLNCRKCHDGSRSREDISVPDLKAAFHRQCLTCHKQWSSENGCSSQCHSRKNTESKLNIDSIKSKSHPQLTLPTKLVWETKSKTNKTVTFFHDEHIQLFKIECKSCHSQESCIKCHAPKARGLGKLIKIEKSVEEHHKPCSNCHTGNSCQKCHKDKEMTAFNHSKASGWELKSYHSGLECSKCHGSKMPYRKLDNNCVTCHKDFASAFDHKLKGFEVSENHKELECKNCHSNGDFTQKPVCSDCHDDKSFPTDVPGKKTGN